MTGDQLVELQQALVWVFAPIIQWWMISLVVFGFVAAVFNTFMALFRWMSK